ncbi:MAG: 3-dehydroquinate synthase, 3-dehydroquinate synthase [Candidatus Gottesmanbacteria bacterium GW2011_GWA2_43_14]|uniref:3-dehydroquinate synthase, 3-dehydroquinate synthase n=1 Tax=Candidatus Gottesmanbacteria bacterium GW2011_GWA2_43_14 TaxID=1618443 RepID=A0A0G1DLA6_9BACT|nr:MAG: 3-dehydroquinate synthase, 3-dehydroquinate synthase [Candidatus Gottesmanbacteria bacterium GW2011_GWA2_43_14]
MNKIIIGQGLLPDLDRLVKGNPYDGYLLLTDKQVYGLYGKKVVGLLSKIAPVRVSIADDGEKAKDLKILPELLAPFFEGKLTRNFCLVSLGGGSISDIGGFIAAILLRGIAHLVIPTTLLSMVDAAIGGKNGLNFKRRGRIYKNAVGTFRLPDLVICDINLLQSLPDREVRNGFGEIIKYRLAFGKPELNGVSAADFQQLSKQKLTSLIRECQQIKMKIVSQDPLDTRGLREALNLGHTVGHAVEGLFPEKFSHGEAVALGLRSAAFMSWDKGLINHHKYNQIVKIIEKCGLQLKIPRVRTAKINDLLDKDKKGGTTVLLKDLGFVVTKQKTDRKLILKAIREIQS